MVNFQMKQHNLQYQHAIAKATVAHGLIKVSV
jgi:hypothetical protein